MNSSLNDSDNESEISHNYSSRNQTLENYNPQTPTSNQMFQRIETLDNEEEGDDVLDFDKTIQVIEDIQEGFYLGDNLHLERKISLFGSQSPETFGADLTDRTWRSNPFYKPIDVGFKIFSKK